MKLRVLIVSNQVRGIDGTGGLGDVATALAKALAAKEDMDVRVLMPGYKTVSGTGVENRFDSVIATEIPIPLGGQLRRAHVCHYFLPISNNDEPRVPCYLLCMDAFDKATDSPEQAILLGRGAIEFLRTFDKFHPDIIHCNDWHTGLIPVYLNTLYRSDPYLGRIATLYTTHNAGYFYQGAFPDDTFTEPTDRLLFQAGFDKSLFQPLQTRSLEHQNRLNFTKGGLGFADLINTVSITYSHEIRTPAFGGGFDHLLQERSRHLCGIVNGIDTAEWNPKNEPTIAPYNFSKSDPIDSVIKQKRLIRKLLKSWQKEGLNPFAEIKDASLIMAFIGRITDQKAAILMPILEKLCGWDNIQIAILGSAHPQDSTGRRYAAEIRDLSEANKNSLFFWEGFETGLSHLIYAAADLFLMPSVYEPCGLAQMISMRYGTLPIVRFVGGIVDTVTDEQAGAKANGFGFKEAVADSFAMADILPAAELLSETLRRAIGLFRNDPQRWQELIRNAMAMDVSWTIPAGQYLKIYQAAIRSRVRSHFLSS
ncbi:MAG: glycogen/starch synthase [Desulfobacterales bacterium]|nr:glycogen/starch synthase [Desulfobacterales bacterium]